nr:ATP-binding protein [Xanthomonas campestris]
MRPVSARRPRPIFRAGGKRLGNPVASLGSNLNLVSPTLPVGCNTFARILQPKPLRVGYTVAKTLPIVMGGGTHPRPGEISLAHNGVLFLDELPEWQRQTLEVLREPLESGVVTISRAARSMDFPARFQLVAAMNPCPCGWAGDASGRCRCSGDAIRRYRSRISGPLLDRIDLHVDVPRLPPQALRSGATGEDSASVRARVAAARDRQQARAQVPNARLDQAATDRHCRLGNDDQLLLERAIEHLQLSARSMHRILRVSRTIADLDDSADIATRHLTEAIGYRKLDRALDTSSAA